MSKFFNKFYNFIDKVGKHNFILIIFIIFVVIITGLYQTFSLYTESEGVNAISGLKTYKFILGANNTTNSVTIAAESSKNIAITVSNESEIDLLYGIYYSSTDDLTDVSIGYLSSSEYLPKGTITSYSDYIITIKIRNLSSNAVTITFGSKYGFEAGGDLTLETNQYWFGEYPEEASVPSLYNNTLIPVYYDETLSSWRITDSSNPDNNWYNYENQKWANVVILNSEVTKGVGDTITVTGDNPDVKAMFVWIPRYEYKIVGTYGTHTDGTAGTASLPGEIEVNFISKNQTTPSDGYTIHPAFTFGGVQQNGIWIGKFETSHTTLSTSTTENNLGCTDENCTNADDLIILPNVETLKYNSISNFFYAARSVSRTGNSFGIDSSKINTHMMKNSEWGAVAYLSQSKYGKYGNELYTDANKEIYQNKSLITGNSNGTPSQETAIETQCTYDDITDRGSGTGSCGGGASTTGNVYGIYDMSGAANEYVMGYLTIASDTWGATSSNDYATFGAAPDSKYFDAYTSTTSSEACNGGICYGHALDEVSAWYEDSVNFISEGSPWLLRGGRYDGIAIVGIFYNSRTNGSQSQSRAFRIVFTSNS